MMKKLSGAFLLFYALIAHANCSDSYAEGKQLISIANAKEDDASAYICLYNKRELEVSGFFGGLNYAASHFGIRCALGAIGGAAVGAKFGGVLGAAGGAAAGCYLFAKSTNVVEAFVSRLDRYIGFTPTPLDKCNKFCSELKEEGQGPGELCKEAK